MFNTYSKFLRDFGIRGLNPYLEYIFILVLIWLLILAIKKVVRFPTKRSFRIFKGSVFLVLLFTVGFVIKELDNISLMVKPIKDNKQFVCELNKALKRRYKPEYEGKNYYISHISEKVNIPGTRKQLLHNYFYKIDKVTTKNVVNSVEWFEKTSYASVSDFVHEIREPEYGDYMKKIIAENKKAEAEAKRKAEEAKKEEEAKKKKEEELKAKESNKEGAKVDSGNVKEVSNTAVKDTNTVDAKESKEDDKDDSIKDSNKGVSKESKEDDKEVSAKEENSGTNKDSKTDVNSETTTKQNNDKKVESSGGKNTDNN